MMNQLPELAATSADADTSDVGSDDPPQPTPSTPASITATQVARPNLDIVT